MFSNKSEVFLSDSGVPQGGHPTPLLFSLFVNSTYSALKHSLLLCFADDMKTFLKINSLNDCRIFQDNFNSFVT